MADPTSETVPTDALAADQPALTDVHQSPEAFVGALTGTGPITSPDQQSIHPEQPALPGSEAFKHGGSVSVKRNTEAGRPQTTPESLNPVTPMQMAGQELGAVNRDTEAAQAAVDQGAVATKKYQAEQYTAFQAHQAEQLQWAAADERASNTAAAEAHQYIGAYAQQIAAVRQMAVDPTGPIGSLTTAQAGGLSLAMFAQGFLAARGIKIDVSGQVDRWVDRSIQEQQRRIQQAQAGAEDQLHLWEISRQVSKDDAEARQRYRGWVIAAMQTSLQANAARYGSDMATAQAAEAHAKLQIEADKSKWSIWKDAYTQVKDDEKTREAIRHDKVTESIQDFSAKSEDEYRKAEAAAKKAAAVPALVPLYDMEQKVDANGTKMVDAQGKPVYDVVGNLNGKDQDAMKKARGSEVAAKELAAGLDDLQKAESAAIAAGAGKGASFFASKKLNPVIRDYDRARERVVSILRHENTGAVFGVKEAKMWEDQLPSPSLWQVGGSENAIPQLREHIRNAYKSNVETYSDTTGMPEVGRRSKADYNAIFNGKPPLPVSTATESGRSGESVGHPGSDLSATHGEASGLFQDFVGASESGTAGEQYTGEGRHTKMVMPGSAVAVDHLALGVVDPTRLRKFAESGIEGVGQVVGDDKKVAEESRATLEDIASGATKASDEVQRYAKFALKQLDKDPASFRKRLEERAP